MSKFLMVCHVATDFIGEKGEKFSVTARERGNFIEAPSWIKDTLIYKWLLADGSIIVAQNAQEKKKLENDPTEGISAEGKAVDQAEDEAQGKPETEDEAEVEAPEGEGSEKPAEETAEKPKKEKKKTEKKNTVEKG